MKRTPRFTSDPKDIIVSVKKFAETVKCRKNMDSYIAFRCGTIVPINKDTKLFRGFTSDYEEGFPSYRVPDTKTMFKENKHDWKWCQTLEKKNDIKI